MIENEEKIIYNEYIIEGGKENEKRRKKKKQPPNFRNEPGGGVY